MKKLIPEDAVLVPDNAERVFEGMIFDVYQWPQELFDGSQHTFEMLKRTDTVSAVCIVDGKILMLDDVRVTKDGVPVLKHDPLDNDRDLVTLKQVLSEFAGFPLYIEIKPREKTEPIINLLRQHSPKDYWLASFDLPTLRQFQQALPEVPKVVLERWSGVRATRRARALGADIICMNHAWLWIGFIRTLSRRGYRLYTYPLNDPKKARRWAKAGLAGVVTDYPDRFQT